MIDASASPKGYCYPKLVISHAVYLYHRLPISVGDGQELLFERGIDVSHETVRAWCVKFGSDLAEALRQRKPKQGCVWHRGEMRIVLGDVTHWLWRAVNEHGEVLDVLLQRTRCKEAAKRSLQRLQGEQEIPEHWQRGFSLWDELRTGPGAGNHGSARSAQDGAALSKTSLSIP